MAILGQMMLFLAIVLGVSNALIMVFSSYELKTAIQRRLKVDAYMAADNKRQPLFKLLDLFVPVNHLILEKFPKFFNREKIEGKLFTARVFLIAEQFLSLKEFFAFFFLALTCLFVKGGDILPLVILPLLGFVAPDLWLSMKIAHRKSLVLRSLPDTVDLLSLCVDAGLDFIASARWIVEKSLKNAFTEELSLVLHEIKVGKSRRDALKDMSRRLSIPDVTAFCRTLIQADKMGIPIADALSVLSADTRERHFRRAEREALKAPIKMLIPLIFFILPVVGVIVGGPVLLQFMKGGIGGGF